jgi:hypothetical protein
MSMKLEPSWQIFEKYSNIKFHDNPSNGNGAVPCRRAGGRKGGRAKRHDEDNNSLSPSIFSHRCGNPQSNKAYVFSSIMLKKKLVCFFRSTQRTHDLYTYHSPHIIKINYEYETHGTCTTNCIEEK